MFVAAFLTSVKPGRARAASNFQAAPRLIMKAIIWPRILWLISNLLPLLLFSGGNRLWAEESNTFAPGTAGHWEGNARIIVVWSRQKNLPVALDIDAGGRVTGKIGDALLTEGRLRKNRGWLDRNLKIKTDYIIVGKLKGPIVAREGITRSEIKMPL